MNPKLMLLLTLACLPACSLVTESAKLLTADGLRYLTDPEGAIEHASSEASSSLQSELDLLKRVRELETIGAGGLADAMPLAEEALADPDERIRCAAIAALRSDRGEAADVAIASRLLKDPSRAVRVAAAEAMTNRNRPEMLSARREAATRDGAPEVRRALMRGLKPLLKQKAELRTLFDRIRTEDADENLRAMATTALAAAGK